MAIPIQVKRYADGKVLAAIYECGRCLVKFKANPKEMYSKPESLCPECEKEVTAKYNKERKKHPI